MEAKKRQRKKQPRKDAESSEDECQEMKSAKKRRTSKQKKSICEEIPEEKSSKMSKAKRKLEQMLKEAEQIEAKTKEAAEAGETEEEKNDREILLKAPWKVDIHTHNDLISIVVDEISLEGLDGITLEALWLRLSIIMAGAVPQVYRDIIWNMVVNNDKLEFYELPEARGKLVIFNRFQHVDVISGHLVDVDEVPEDVYPFAPLPDEKSTQLNIYGSCATFDTRVNVSEKLRNLTLNEAESLGNKIVIVADQSLRNECLGLNEAKSLTKIYNQHYTLLERIGRARKLGESSSGKTSLRQFGDSKDMFYLRKVLVKNDLITKQQLCFKNKGGVGNTSALLFHLKRFYFHYKTKKLLVIEQIVDMLKKKPHFRMEYVELKQIFGLDMWQNAVVKMLKGSELKQFVNTNVLVAYRDIYPNAPKDEWMGKSKREKNIRVIQLIDPNVNVTNSLKEITKEDLQKDDSSDDEPLCEGPFNKSAFNQIYNLIYASGEEGLTQGQICLKLGLDIYHSRIAVKSLAKENLIYSTNADLGCLRVLKFFATSYQKQKAQEHQGVAEETDEEALDFISNVLEIDKKHLRSSNDEVRVDEDAVNLAESNPLSGQYGFIKEYRKKCRQDKYNTRFRGKFYEVEDLEGDKQKIEEILRNEHDFFDMDESINNGIIKKLGSNVIFTGQNVRFEEENVGKSEGFDSFDEIYKIPKGKPIVDYGFVQSQVTHFLCANSNKGFRKIFHDNPENITSVKIIVDYLKINSDISIKDLFDKFDEFVHLIIEQRSNQSIEYPKELDESDEEETSEAIEEVSLAQNFENEAFGPVQISEEIKSFKEDLINNFERYDFGVVQQFMESQKEVSIEENPTKNIEDLKEIVLVKANEGESLKGAFDEEPPGSLKEFSRDHFNTMVRDFQIESFFGESILVNYFPLDKDQIETIVVFSKNKDVNINLGTKYINRSLSQRALDRANYMLNVVYKDKIVSDVSAVLNGLKKDELDRGLVGTIDRKSMNRLVEKMVNEGYLMTIKVVLRHKKSVRIKHIIALPNSDYQPILNAVKEQMKMSFFIYSRRKNVSYGPCEISGNSEDIASSSSAKMQEIEIDVNGTPKFRRNKYIGKYYGYLPKNSRHKVLHEFLFYLVYSYDGKLIEKPDLPNYIKENNLEEYPLYQKDISWKMFIPPPSAYKNYPFGWILYCDALLRMPISVFVKIYNIVYVMPELVQILNDPIKKYLLLQNIPPKIRNACFFKRKYIFSIYEGLQYLCYQGLLQFGEQPISTKDQQFLYLNRRAIIYDTTSSNPGYHQTTEKEYPKLSFELQTEEDLEIYWNKVWNICLKTRLGSRYSLLHQTITLQHIHGIPVMIEATQPRSHEEAIRNDVGYIPGDGRGACGFDSNSWMFVRRNWVENSVVKDSGKFDASSSRPIGIRKKQLDKAKMKSIKLKDLQREVLRKKRKKKVGAEAVDNLQKTEQTSQGACKPKKVSKNIPFTRKIHPRPPKKKTKRVDELDKSIKKSGLFVRSKFTQIEDNMLIIISYAIRYLFPAYKKRLLSFTVIRDLMHRLCPKNSKKTSTAYNSRLRKFYTFVNKPLDIDAHNVSLEADNFVQKHFSRFKAKILSGQTIPQDHLHIALIYLVAYCVDSFEKNATTSKKILDEVEYVDYLESFDQQTKPETKNSLYQDPTSKEEVLIDTVKAVIHASVGFEVNETIKVVHEHLDKVYQTYSEEILRKSVLSLREHNLIKTPIVHKKSKKTKSESILQTSYMYSYKQVTKFPETIYIEAYSVFDAFRHPEEIRKFNPNSYQEGFGLGFSELQTIATISVFIEIPDKQFILDPNTENHDSVIEELNARYRRLVSKKTTDQEVMAETKDNQEKSEIADKDDNTLRDLEELSQCIKDRDYDKINTKMSDLAFLLTKGLFPELEDEDDRLERLSRHFLMMYPETGFKIDRFRDEAVVDEIVRMDGMEKIKEAIYRDCVLGDFQMSINEVEGSFRDINAHLIDIETAVRLLEFLQSKEIFGAAGNELKEKFANDLGVLSLNEIIGHLMNIGAISRFGVKTFRFVHHDFKDVWTVDGKREGEGEEEAKSGLKLKPVPWLKINGTVNEKVLVDWLFTLQSYCVSNPLATFPSLCKRFNFLKPVDVYALLEYLQLLNCLQLKCYENVEEVTIYSECAEVESRKSNCLDNLDDVYIETDNLAVVKLGAFSRTDQDLMSPFEC